MSVQGNRLQEYMDKLEFSMSGMSGCTHDVAYHGVINLNEYGINVGAVDLWRCRVCKELFADVKKIGDTKLEPKVGFDRAPPGSRWAVLVCRGPKGLDWRLVTVRPGKFDHECSLQGRVTLEIGEDFVIKRQASEEGEHTIFLVEENLNKALEIGV